MLWGVPQKLVFPLEGFALALIIFVIGRATLNHGISVNYHRVLTICSHPGKHYQEHPLNAFIRQKLRNNTALHAMHVHAHTLLARYFPGEQDNSCSQSVSSGLLLPTLNGELSTVYAAVGNRYVPCQQSCVSPRVRVFHTEQPQMERIEVRGIDGDGSALSYVTPHPRSIQPGRGRPLMSNMSGP